jgi:hypothetical protein
MSISAEATKPAILLNNTCLFLIYYYSSASGLDYTKIELRLSTGNRLELPERILKQTPISLKSLLKGVPELNYIYNLLDINY